MFLRASLYVIFCLAWVACPASTDDENESNIIPPKPESGGDDSGDDPSQNDAGRLGKDAGGESTASVDSGALEQVIDAGSTLESLDGAVAILDDAGTHIGPTLGDSPMNDFSLVDTNPYSPTHGQSFSPRQYVGRVSAWYFGSGG